MLTLLSMYWRFWDQSSVDWCLSNEQGVLSSGTGTPVSIGQQLGEQAPDQIELWLGGEQVLQVAVQTPAQGRKLPSSAVLYLAEEYLAQDINEVHWVVADTDGQTAEVCIVDDAKFQALLRHLAEAHIKPDRILPDFLGFSSTEAGILALEDEGRRALLRLNKPKAGEVGGIAGPLDLIIATLSQIQGSERELPALELVGASSEMVQKLQSRLSHWRILPGAPATDFLVQLRGKSRTAPVNLSCGPYQKRRSRRISRRASQFLAVCVSLVFTSLLIKIAWFELNTLRLEAKSHQLYLAALPGQSLSGSEIDRQLREHLRQNDDTSILDFLYLVSRLSETADRFPEGNLSLESLSYRDSRLVLRLLVGSFEQLDRLDQMLSEAGLRVGISSAQQGTDTVRAEIRLRR